MHFGKHYLLRQAHYTLFMEKEVQLFCQIICQTFFEKNRGEIKNIEKGKKQEIYAKTVTVFALLSFQGRLNTRIYLIIDSTRKRLQKERHYSAKPY